MKHVVILIGPSGSGKSTWAEKQLGFGTIKVVSADKFFVGQDGEYRFDPALLGAAHGACMRDFVNAVVHGFSGVTIVDNTNGSIGEIAPYVALAQAYGAAVEFLYFGTTTVEECIERTQHGVPPETIRRQHAGIVKMFSEWPPWWPTPIPTTSTP